MSSRLLIEYDGTELSGWAKQPGRRTVEGELERALRVLLRRNSVGMSVAGRTDAGVHASGQVASYDGPPARPQSLNALLPYDIAVLECEPAAPGFDARRDATSRAYRYRLLTRSARSPAERRRALHWPYPLDRPSLDACARTLVGTHDFTAFTPSRTKHAHFERHVLAAAWSEPQPGLLELEIEATSFLRSMIRVLVGTLLEVGSGRRPAERFVALLDGSPRSEAGVTAPPHGLELIGVGYGDIPVLGQL